MGYIWVGCSIRQFDIFESSYNLVYLKYNTINFKPKWDIFSDLYKGPMKLYILYNRYTFWIIWIFFSSTCPLKCVRRVQNKIIYISSYEQDELCINITSSGL